MTGPARIWMSLRLGLWALAAVVGVSIALGPLVSSQYYLVPGAFMAALVIVTGALLRAAGARWPVVASAEAVVLAEVVTLAYAREGATLGFLPDRDTVQILAATVRDTLAHAQEYPPPVPTLDALDATLAVGMGLLAVVVDLLAASRRTVPLVGLVFLTVYMTPVSLLNGHVTMWAFVPGALGFVFLLAASERRHAVGWGHHLADLGRYATGLDEAATRGRGLAVTGRRAGLGAVACAVIVPLFVPTLTPQLFGEGGSGLGGGNGFGDVTVDNPILDMRRNLTGQSNAVLVRVKDASAPPAYLRLTALTDLTSKGWGPGERGRDTEPVDASLPDAPGVGAEVVQTTVGGRVTLTDAFHTRWLPVVYAPRSIAVDGPWRVDRDNLDIMAGRKDLDGAGVTYTFSSAVIEPTPEQLRSAPSSGRDMRGMTLTPPSMPDSIKQRAREVTKGQDNEFDKALALQRWFRSEGGFEYDLTPRFDGSGMETIARFVDDDRRGYCEQFASAMAMMARTLEIPARVAVGFLRPERNGDVFVFRGTDMHSWPELFFDGVGWVRFEPTPGGSGYTAPSFGTVDTPNGAVAPSLQGDRGQAAQPQATKTAPPLAVDGGTAPEGTSWGEMVAVGVAALVALLLLAAPFLVRTTVSRRRWRRAVDGPARAEAAWAELRSRALDLGVPWDPDATPRSTGRELRDRVAGDADATGALDLLVTQIERARYDRDCEPSGLRAAVDRVVACLAVRSTRRRRLIARWLPTAWLHGLTTSGRRTRDDGSGLIALRE